MLIGTAANFTKCVQLTPQLVQDMKRYSEVYRLVYYDVEHGDDNFEMLYARTDGINVCFLLLNNLSLILMILYAALAVGDGVSILIPSLVGNLFALLVGLAVHTVRTLTVRTITRLYPVVRTVIES